MVRSSSHMNCPRSFYNVYAKLDGIKRIVTKDMTTDRITQQGSCPVIIHPHFGRPNVSRFSGNFINSHIHECKSITITIHDAVFVITISINNQAQIASCVNAWRPWTQMVIATKCIYKQWICINITGPRIAAIYIIIRNKRCCRTTHMELTA